MLRKERKRAGRREAGEEGKHRKEWRREIEEGRREREKERKEKEKTEKEEISLTPHE